MPLQTDSLFFTTLFESPAGDGLRHRHYRDVVLHTLRKVLPPNFFVKKENADATRRHQHELLQQAIPLVTFSEIHSVPGTLSFFLLSKYKPNSFKFFFEMISRWLTPGRRLNVVLVYATDFRLTQASEELYTICEVMISIASQDELDEIRRNFSIIQAEIRLGVGSDFYAHRIMEIKGLSADDQTALIQESIALLVKRFPSYYDSDVFTEMQHVLVGCADIFKQERRARHLCRIISIQYLFRKGLRESVKKSPTKRHMHLKIFRSFVRGANGPKRVLGILVGMNFIRDQESFGERNFVKAVQHIFPSAQSVENSFFLHKLGSEHICLAYLEIEKQDGSSFTPPEMRRLRRELPPNLKNRIEHRLHTVFMPRNEEEVMRTILTLANQIRYVRDIPQVSITFEEQAHSHLYFTIILVRLLKPESGSICDLFKGNNRFFEYLHDRTKLLGKVRKKYDKEATVFRLKLPKDTFLRADHSIDLYKARQAVVEELQRVVGEIRDFNGGMISKQHELLSQIRDLLIPIRDYDEMLLDNFFYSVSPAVARAVLDPESFKILFLMLLEGLRECKPDHPYLKFHEEKHRLFAMVVVEDLALRDAIQRSLQSLHLPPVELTFASIKTNGYSCLGFICTSQDPHKRQLVQHAIEQIGYQ